MQTETCAQRQSDESVDSALDRRTQLVLECARVLYTNGQTTDQTLAASARLASQLGLQLNIEARWDELSLQRDDHPDSVVVGSAASPSGIEMARVAAAMRLVDVTVAGTISVDRAAEQLRTISTMPPAPAWLFMLAAGVGAAALAVINGIEHVAPAVLIFASAAAGAVARRGLARYSGNLFVQPAAAALLAGIVGAVATRYHLSSSLRLVALCPCMVLVPGPHILNSSLDLIRGRIHLGAARAIYAALVIAAIVVGLLLGLTLGGIQLPVDPAGRAVPLWIDVIAAGVAVAAYSIFFSSPLRLLPWPILVGMLAHACRWLVLTLFSASAAIGACVACVVAGVILTLVSRRTGTPFAAIGFASVVSMMPGIFIFRMASGLEQLAHGKVTLALLAGTFDDAMTALTIIVAMSLGLVVPKLVIDHFGERNARKGRTAA